MGTDTLLFSVGGFPIRVWIGTRLPSRISGIRWWTRTFRIIFPLRWISTVTRTGTFLLMGGISSIRFRLGTFRIWGSSTILSRMGTIPVLGISSIRFRLGILPLLSPRFCFLPSLLCRFHLYQRHLPRIGFWRRRWVFSWVSGFFRRRSLNLKGLENDLDFFLPCSEDIWWLMLSWNGLPVP